MNHAEAVNWLLRMDSLHGSSFHLDDLLDDAKYEQTAEVWDFFAFCEAEGFDPYGFAISVMPSFAQQLERMAD